MEKINNKITAEGLKPSATTFQTQKEFLRKAIKDCSREAKNFEAFQSLLLENYNISVISQRGMYRYLHPTASQRITEKALVRTMDWIIWKNFSPGLYKGYVQRKKQQ